MFFLVQIKQSREILIIPSKWIRNVDLIKFLNYGPSYHKNIYFVAFYSKNSYMEPNFDRRVLPQFDVKKDACYNVKLIKSFGNQILVIQKPTKPI